MDTRANAHTTSGTADNILVHMRHVYFYIHSRCSHVNMQVAFGTFYIANQNKLNIFPILRTLQVGSGMSSWIPQFMRSLAIYLANSHLEMPSPRIYHGTDLAGRNRRERDGFSRWYMFFWAGRWTRCPIGTTSPIRLGTLITQYGQSVAISF